MADTRQAALRHATHYVRLAREHGTNFSQMTVDFPNFMRAGDFCIQFTDWNLLAGLTDAMNEYLLRTGQWLDYIKLNTPLVKSDLTDERDARITRVLQLIELEENRGNFRQALDWTKFLVELHQNGESRNIGESIKALKKLARLNQRFGNDSDAAAYLMQGLALAREVSDRKNEIDILYELALFYKREREFEKSQLICESAITLARSIGYSVAELDILALLASLYVNHDHDRALSVYQQALDIANTLSDVERQATLREEVKILEERMATERESKRKVFISYNHQDRAFAQQLANDLREHGLSVWWDQWAIRVGESIIQRINDGIDSSAYLIAVLSSHSVQSDFVRREIGSALMKQLSTEKNIIILPLLVTDCEVPPLLREIKWADFRQNYDEGLKSLLERLQDTATGQV